VKVEVINPLFLLTAKPVVYLINLSEKDYIRKKNKHLAKVMEWIKEHAAGDPIMPISICLEERLTRFETEKEAAEELKTLGVESALPKIITAMRKVLNLGSFFTTGTDEVRQWTIRNGTKAPQAAGVIHGDFEKTFIQAIVYNFAVLKELGDEAEVKAKGKVLTKGKDYVVEDGDSSYSECLFFLFILSKDDNANPVLDSSAHQSWRCQGIKESIILQDKRLFPIRCDFLIVG
jgi:obg-like ATPase 1